MIGPFGGVLTAEGARASEPLPETLAPVLTGDEGEGLSATAGSEDRAALVPYTVAGDTLSYAGSLSGLSPLAVGARGPRLRGLSQAMAALEDLHQTGRAHGDLRPGTVWLGEEKAALIVSARSVDAGALLRGRMREGADPADAVFVAPEVLAGSPATPESDVYSAGALAFWILAGRPAMGRLAIGLVTEHLGDDATFALAAALHDDPAERGGLEALRSALVEAARVLIDLEAFTLEGAPEGSEAPPAARLILPEERAAQAKQEAAGQQMSVILVLVLAVASMFILVGALYVVINAWEDIGTIGQLVLLLLLTGGVWVGGLGLERKGFDRSGFAMVVVGSQLLWINLTYLLVRNDIADEAGPWALGSAVLVAVTFGLAVRRRSYVFGALTAFGFVVSSMTFGEHISSGTWYGPPVYFLLVSMAYLGLAVLGKRLCGRQIALPCGIGAGFWLWISAGYALAVLGMSTDSWRTNAPLTSYQVFGTLWPYGVGGTIALAAFALGLTGVYRALAGIALGGVILFVPTVQAFICHDQLPYLFWTVGLGLLTLAAAFHVKPIAERVGPQTATLIVGLATATFAPLCLCIAKCADRDGFKLLMEALESGGRVYETRFVYLSIVVGLSAGLVGLGYMFSKNAKRKASYRVLEASGLVLYLFVLTILSIPDVRHEFFYAGLIVVGGAAVIGLGIWGQRAMLVAISSIALVLNLIIQYFAKVDIHGGFLALGFGLALLGAGILYERKVKHMLPALWKWA